MNTTTNIAKDLYYIWDMTDWSRSSIGIGCPQVASKTRKLRPTGSQHYYCLSCVSIYGSSRLGGIKPQVEWVNNIADTPTYQDSISLGWKYYESSNHLGNVLSVPNDRKEKMDLDGDNVADYFEATILSATDYYPFGDRSRARHPKCLVSEGNEAPTPQRSEEWLRSQDAHQERSCGQDMPSRTFASSDYRYAFNGKEKDNSFSDGTSYDYGFRIYNPEIAKFLSVDPLTKNYPWYTPYQFAGNKPIWAIDLDGLEEYFFTLTGSGDNTQVELTDIKDLETKRYVFHGPMPTSYGYRTYHRENVINQEQKYYVQYQFQDIIMVDVVAKQVVLTHTKEFDTLEEALEATVDDFEQEQIKHEISKGMMAQSLYGGANGGKTMRTTTNRVFDKNKISTSNKKKKNSQPAEEFITPYSNSSGTVAKVNKTNKNHPDHVGPKAIFKLTTKGGKVSYHKANLENMNPDTGLPSYIGKLNRMNKESKVEKVFSSEKISNSEVINLKNELKTNG